MGVAVASHPMVKAGDPVLRQRLSNTESFEANITSEEIDLFHQPGPRAKSRYTPEQLETSTAASLQSWMPERRSSGYVIVWMLSIRMPSRK